jgi:hypothetical protein
MVSTVSWIFLLVALVCGPTVAGALRRKAPRPDWIAVGGAALVGAVFGVLAATAYETGVSTEDAIKGVALAIVVGAFPAYGLYEVGRALASRRVVLGFACLMLTAPLAALYFVGWIFVLALVHCPPDAYECPL